MSYRIKLVSPAKEDSKTGKTKDGESYYLRCGDSITYFETEEAALNRQIQILEFLEDPNPLRKTFLSELRGTTVEIEKFEKEGN